MTRPPIYLDPAEPRCRHRGEFCSRTTFCARALADLPTRNATVADFSLALDGCLHFLSSADAVKPVAERVVKPAIGGGV